MPTQLPVNESHEMNSGLRFSHPVTRAPHAIGAHCDIRQFRHTDFGSAMSPLVLVDHFVMTGPTFELHPHAGMSAVTVLFEDTQGWMSSHDSVNSDHRIEPGDLHWTLAGKGIVHTQQPEGEDARLDGLQLFVNLPRRLKRIEPATMLVHARDVPVIEGPGLRLRVLAGELDAKTSPLRTPEPILIVDGWLDSGARTVLPLPSGWNLWLYARSEHLAAHDLGAPESGGGTMLSFGEAVAVSAGDAGSAELRPSAGAVKFVAIAGPAINEPIVQMGPFVMNSREEAEQAFADFQAGKFGTVMPFA
jgi:redox-sensitive bicupin YhaK (pirin superfamily)